MRKRVTMLVAATLLLAASPILLRRRSVPLVCNGKTVAVAYIPSNLLPGDKEYCVYAGKKKLFGLWGDFWDAPILICPFSDAQRFLCVDNDDTAILVFILDFRPSAASIPYMQGWPPDDYTRDYLARRASNVVMNTTGVVRLPSSAEVEEISEYVATLTPGQYRTASIPHVDVGFLRRYTPKEMMLHELSTNRQSAW